MIKKLSLLFSLFLLVATGTNTQNRGINILQDRIDWLSASKFCTQHRGNLSSIHNVFDVTLLRKLGVDSSCSNYWIGAKCDSGDCTWSDGTTFDYKNFDTNQPDQANECVVMDAKTGKWKTTSCDQKSCFACLQDNIMTDCEDWYQAGYEESNYYSIVIAGASQEVYCDMNNGGGWTVFQRRSNGAYSFYDKTWAEYKNGFEYDSANFWLGNDNINQLTMKDDNVTLRVEMYGDRTPNSTVGNDYWWAHYNHFQVLDEASNYTLNVATAGWWPNFVGNATTGWYDLTCHTGRPFSTIDRINDPMAACVTDYHLGGWWLYNCAFESLNGEYVPKGWVDGYGMFWIINGSEELIHPRESLMMLRRERNNSL